MIRECNLGKINNRLEINGNLNCQIKTRSKKKSLKKKKTWLNRKMKWISIRHIMECLCLLMSQSTTKKTCWNRYAVANGSTWKQQVQFKLNLGSKTPIWIHKHVLTLKMTNWGLLVWETKSWINKNKMQQWNFFSNFCFKERMNSSISKQRLVFNNNHLWKIE